MSLVKPLSTLLVPGAQFRRLPDIIRSVWELLPDADREYIAANVYFTVHDSGHPSFADSLAAGATWVNDNPSNAAQFSSRRLSIDGLSGNYYRISFKDDLDSDENYPDAELGDIVAHEFAHVVLRHGQLTLRLVESGIATWDGLDERVRTTLELSADSQVLNWQLDQGIVPADRALCRMQSWTTQTRGICPVTRKKCVNTSELD